MKLTNSVRQRMRAGTLESMDDETITENLVSGQMSSGFSDQLAWEHIAKRVAEYETARVQPIVIWRQEQVTIDSQRNDVQIELDRLQQELLQLNQQHQTLEELILEHAMAHPEPDLSRLLQFAQRVQPIEQRLVEQLEEEMGQKKFQLAALSDQTSSQPKLSLLLNCMGVGEAAIAATRDLNSTAFKRLTKWNQEYFESPNAVLVSPEDSRDLLYCGEMLRNAEFPYEYHDHECVVCANQTAQQMVNFIRERNDINLPEDVLLRKKINGRRALYGRTSDFPGCHERQVMAALERLRELHEEAM